MKQYKSFLVGVLVTVLASTLFWAGTVYAATGCFPDTNGHWAETFICWLKDNGITSGYPDGTYGPGNNVSRAEMSVFLQRIYNLANSSAQTKATTAENNAKAYADSLVNTPPSTGEIRINSGPNSWDWMGTQPGPLSIYRYDVFTMFTSSTNNNYATLIMTPDFPSALYGRVLNVIGMEYCYTANANAYIDRVFAFYTNQTANAGGVFTALVSDETNRTDAACRYYSITPKAIDDNTILSMYLFAAWGPAGAGAELRLGHVTFFFQPTAAAVPAPKGLETFGEESPDVTRPDQ